MQKKSQHFNQESVASQMKAEQAALQLQAEAWVHVSPDPIHGLQVSSKEAKHRGCLGQNAMTGLFSRLDVMPWDQRAGLGQG